VRGLHLVSFGALGGPLATLNRLRRRTVTARSDSFLADQHVSTWLRLDYFRSSNSLDETRNLVGGTLQIKALPRLNESLDAKIEGRLAEPDIRGRPGYGPESQLLEGYLNHPLWSR